MPDGRRAHLPDGHHGVYSRFIVGWREHNSLDASSCMRCSKEPTRYGVPEIINSDKRLKFACQDWKATCAEFPEMRISMEDRRCAKDKIWMECSWRAKKK